MPEPRMFPLPDYREYPPEEMARRAAEFYAEVNRRRTVRQIGNRPVPEAIIRDCLRAAGTAPSGANLQPWLDFPDKKEGTIPKKEVRFSLAM